tara:strand:- start:8065 stop:8295 length:231 start_codon:yes stop_codon:yes gene_type:complete
MKDTVIEILKGHFGDDKEINESSHMMDDLGGDEFDILDVIVQVESKLGISIPEEETFEVRTVSELLEVVGRHVQSD